MAPTLRNPRPDDPTKANMTNKPHMVAHSGFDPRCRARQRKNGCGCRFTKATRGSAEKRPQATWVLVTFFPLLAAFWRLSFHGIQGHVRKPACKHTPHFKALANIWPNCKSVAQRSTKVCERGLLRRVVCCSFGLANPPFV